jgi:Phospholipase_D-nuclease N-terminal/Short C-terminal domain
VNGSFGDVLGAATEWSFGDVLLAMIAFFFWVVFFWMFIAAFGDIFRRDDLSGWAKAGWILLIFVFPFLGVLIYMVARPKMTAQDEDLFAEAEERERRMKGYSAADEIAKLTRLRDEGEISPQEYERLKERALV